MRRLEAFSEPSTNRPQRTICQDCVHLGLGEYTIRQNRIYFGLGDLGGSFYGLNPQSREQTQRILCSTIRLYA